MANTTSARKATRKIARRTAINKSRRTGMRNSVRAVEQAVAKGDRDARDQGAEARRAGTDARGAEEHRSQERGEPEGVAPRTSDREARKISFASETESACSPAPPGFLFVALTTSSERSLMPQRTLTAAELIARSFVTVAVAPHCTRAVRRSSQPFATFYREKVGCAFCAKKYANQELLRWIVESSSWKTSRSAQARDDTFKK